MAHINSYSKEIDGKHWLFTKPKKGKEIRLGGPYKSSAEADFYSRDASKYAGEGSIAEYQQYLESLHWRSNEGRPKIFKDPIPVPRFKPPKPKPKKAKRKGGNVKGYLTGDLINPLGGGTPQATPQGAGIGKGVAPQKKPQNPLAAQDALLKKKADQKKRIDLAGKPGTPQAPPKPGMAQKPPPVLGRKGGKIKMRKGDAVKSYSNICRSPVPRA